MNMNISKALKFTRVSNYASAATTAINSSAVDMKGFESCAFVVACGTITDSPQTTTVDVKVQQCVDSGSSPETWADLAGTKISYTYQGDSKLAIAEIVQPTERYLRCVVTRTGGNSAVDAIIAIQGGATAEPVTHDSTTVLGAELHQAPAEGTA
jgi:hypothetical protein